MKRLLLAAALLGLAGCVSPLAPGQWGTFRYFGDVTGTAPLRLVPPIVDRNGDAYVLYGSQDRAEARVYAGAVGGGWNNGCSVYKGDSRGVHGWIGAIEDRAWYWAGDGLVQVQGATGSCGLVLANDPFSNADLLMAAVFPYVSESPSHIMMVALIQGATDPRPFTVQIDLALGRYVGTPQPFTPADATGVVIAGTGANPDTGELFYLVTYTEGGTTRTEARFLDPNGNPTATVPLDASLPPLGIDSIAGFLQASPADGHVVGLTRSGMVIQFDHHTSQHAYAVMLSSITAAGVHRAGGGLYLVGMLGSRPAVAPFQGDWTVGQDTEWTASLQAADGLTGGIQVLDDRTTSTSYTQWPKVQSAIGIAPFVSPWMPNHYSAGTVGWVVAGPSYPTGVEGMTSSAFSPVGISYP